MVSLLILIPLLLTLMTAVAAAVFILKRKSLAQSLCVRQVVKLQTELKPRLERLIKHNREARRLRAEKQRADQALKAALAANNPPAITAAKVWQTAVFLQQTALKLKQQKILVSAANLRRAHARELRADVRSLGVMDVQSQAFYSRPLGVYPSPTTSLTPDYLPTPTFQWHQQHRFRFKVILNPRFLPGASIQQFTTCAASLREERQKEKQWQPQLLAVSP